MASDALSVRVVGSRSGEHAGRLLADPDGQGVTFTPSRPFAAGETVRVTTSVPVRGGASDGYEFTVGRPAPHPGLEAIDALDTDGAANTGSAAQSTGAGRAAAVSPSRFASRPDLRPPAVRIDHAATGTAPGYVFATPIGSATNDGGVMVYDDTGELVWFHPEPDTAKLVVDAEVVTYKGKPAIAWFEGSSLFSVGNFRGEWVVVDQAYREIGRIRMGNGYLADAHDIELTNRGTAYLVGYNPLVCTGVAPLAGCRPGSTVLEAVVQEVDVETGIVLWEWHSLDHVPLTRSYDPIDGPLVDYFHINSASQDTDGHLLVSSRHTSTIYKVDRTTGDVIWTLGGKASTFTTYVNEPNAIKGPDYQHMVTALGNDTYSYFDNGNRRGGPSRGAIVHLDVPTKTATYTKTLIHDPPIFGSSQGTFEPLSNGNSVVGWGGSGSVTEYSPAGSVAFDATLVGTGSYRQIRSPWVGAPAASPNAVLSPASGANPPTARASWNGDTRTARWRLLTGPAANQLSVARTVSRTGFETDLGSTGSAAWFAVEAVAPDGTVLGRSAPVRGAAWFTETTTTDVRGTYSVIVGDFSGSRNDDIVWYAPGLGSEWTYVADGTGTFTKVGLPQVTATHFALVGDFVGDDRDEIMWWTPGNPRAVMWRFDGRDRDSSPLPTRASFDVPTSGSPLVLDNRPGFGGSYDQIFWYAPGSAPDRLDGYVWTSTRGPATVRHAASVQGSYRAVTGDFDGNGWADLLWYAPGSATDSLWLMAGSGHRSVAVTIKGRYTTFTANFRGTDERDELLLATPGGGADTLWSFNAAGGHTAATVTTSVGGELLRLRDTNDDVLGWVSGSSPSIWTLSPTSVARPSRNRALGPEARPIVGSFVGAADRSSVYWYTPGSTPEVMFAIR